MYCVYILYSSQMDRYYVGYTADLEDRIRKQRIRVVSRTSIKLVPLSWYIFALLSDYIANTLNLSYV